jgi:DNA-binding CsgD family transcriptional regulator
MNNHHFMELSEIKASLDAILSKQDFGNEIPDYRTIESSVSMLERMAEVENSSIAVFDLYKKGFTAIRPKFREKVEVDLEEARVMGPAYYIARMHPDDAPVVLDTYRKVFEFSFDLPLKERKEYKTVFNFRLGHQGKYFHFVQQLVTLELTPEGRIWLGLSLSDLLPDNLQFDRVHRTVVNLRTGKRYLFNEEESGYSIQKLSTRELEVLGLISKGFASKEIAGKLFLSVNTVNNHRQNILEKINAANTGEAVSYARSLGLI